MGAGLIAINIFFAVFVLVAIPGPLIWAIVTAHRDQDRAPPAVEPLTVEALVSELEPVSSKRRGGVVSEEAAVPPALI